MKTLLLPLSFAALLLPAAAAPLRSAEVTTVINDVRVYRKTTSVSVAKQGDRVTGTDAVHTGRNSRAELRFPDQSVTRIGANSIFSFRSGSRDMEIKQGSFLLQVPKNAGGATIRTATVTAAITGTTTLMECNPGHWIKFITLEGTAKLRHNNGGEFMDIPPGQMIVMRPDDNRVPRPIVVNVGKLVKTSKLLGKNFGPLKEEADALVDQTVQDQKNLRDMGKLVPAGVLIGGPSINRGGGRDPDNSVIPSLPSGGRGGNDDYYDDCSYGNGHGNDSPL
jgi:hypothetical protein